jgi:tetratricopeptide (TPR) repeat protein
VLNPFTLRVLSPAKLLSLMVAFSVTLSPLVMDAPAMADESSDRITKLTQAIDKNPSSSELGKWYAMRGASYFLAKDYPKAELDLKTAITKGYENADVNVILSSINRIQNNKTQAQTYIDRALALRPDARSYVARAEHYYTFRDYAASLADAEKAFSLNPTEKFVKRYLGLNQTELGNYEAAIDNLTAALAETPLDTHVYLVRGVAHMKLSHFDQALADFDQAIQLSPNHTTAQSNRGLTLAAMQRYEEALNQFNSLMKYYESTKQTSALNKAHYFRAIVHYGLADYSNAKSDIQVALKSDPKNEQYLKWNTRIEEKLAAPKS